MAGKKEKSRQKIMHAAKGLFEEYGIEAITFKQIADEADVCRTTVFNHFASTKELMLAIFSQEIEDLTCYCNESGFEDREKVLALFDKLIEDTSYYPLLATQLIQNAILSKDEENPIALIEKTVCHALGNNENAAVSAMGAYLGLITHYHIHKLTFDAEKMKAEFRNLFANIC